jgi:hypothetical protein
VESISDKDAARAPGLLVHQIWKDSKAQNLEITIAMQPASTDVGYGIRGIHIDRRIVYTDAFDVAAVVALLSRLPCPTMMITGDGIPKLPGR